MKKTKLIIPAMGLLLLSTAASVTGTVAWFSMNAEVTATGMQITAKSDSIFLEIKGTEDAGYTSTGTNDVDEELFPVHHEAWSSVADITTFKLSASETNNNWYYRYNENNNNATNAMSAKTYIGSFDDYVAVTTFSVKLHDGSQDTAYDLYVSDMSITANSGITVVVAGANGYQEFGATSSDIAFNAANILSNTVTTAEQVISVYLYINGDDANVYTDNISHLTGEVEFKLKAFTSDQNA